MLSKNNVILLSVVLLASILRLWGLGECPLWDYDEGVNMNIAWNLIHGNLLWFNLKYAFVPHPPLFFIIVGMLLKTFGNDLIVIRSLIAFYGILTAIVLFYTGKELKDERLGLLMSFLFATYPNAIFFGRIGYANNQLALLSTLVFFLCLKYHKHKNKNLLFVIPLLAGLAPVTEFGGLAILLSVNLFFLLYDKKNMRRILIISIIPLTLYIAAMLLISPNAFLHDIFFNSQRLGTLGADKQNRNDPIMTGTIVLISIFFVAVLYRKRKKIIELYQNLALFIFSSFLPRINIKDVNSILKDNLAIALFSLTLFPAGWILSLSHKIFFDGYPDYFLIGLLGLLFVPNRQARNTVFLFFIPSLIYFLRVTRTDHMMLPLYPYMIIGLAFLILWLLEQFKSSPRLKNIARPASILIMVPLLLVVCVDVSLFILGPEFSFEDAGAHRELASYLNMNTNKTDIVVVDVHTARLIDARVTEPLISYIEDHRRIFYMDPNLSDDRFAFNASYRNAKYFVLFASAEELRYNVCYADLTDVMDDLNSWPLVRVNKYYVYSNPYL